MSLNFFNEPCQWSMISSLMCLEGSTIRKGSSTNWTFLPGYQPNYYIFKCLLDKYWQILVSWYLLQNASRAVLNYLVVWRPCCTSSTPWWLKEIVPAILYRRWETFSVSFCCYDHVSSSDWLISVTKSLLIGCGLSMVYFNVRFNWFKTLGWIYWFIIKLAHSCSFIRWHQPFSNDGASDKEKEEYHGWWLWTAVTYLSMEWYWSWQSFQSETDRTWKSSPGR